MPNWARLRREVRRLRETLGTARDRCSESARYAWYAGGCPCGEGAGVGRCREHPRARPDQRPPGGDWRAWVMLCGRGAGKTRAAAEWVRHRVESGQARRVALLGATAADVRDVMVEGPSGILAVCPPWARPRYEPSKRRLSWPNGAVALTFSADEPNRLRGPQHDMAWVDEAAAFRGPAALDQLLFGLRLGSDPRVCVTTTPRPHKWLAQLLADPTTAVTKASTYHNREHLAPSFFDRIVTRFEGTRLGRQELLAEILEVSDGAWFTTFDPQRHVTELAEYHPGYPVHLAIDCGVSRHTAAVWFQVRPLAPRAIWDYPVRIDAVLGSTGWTVPPTPPPRSTLERGPRQTVCAYASLHIEGAYSADAARQIRDYGEGLPECGGRPDTVRLDPAATARTGIGPTAFSEFAAVFGPTITGHWPRHRVQDGLDQVEVMLDSGCLLIHPRCEALKCAMLNYSRKQTTAGDWLDEPRDPQHPHEDLVDALRGGIRDRYPEGRIEQPRLGRMRGY